MGGDPEKTSRNDQIWAMYCDGITQAEIASRFGLSNVRIWQIVQTYRAALPMRDRGQIARELQAEIDTLRHQLGEIAESAPKPIIDGEGNTVALDHTGRIIAMRELRKTNESQRKLLGLDSAVKIEADTTVRYVVEEGDREAMQ